MFFIFNHSLLFDPKAQSISLVGQPESAITLSAPAVRLLQEFIRHKGSDLSREQLITRVWDEYGFTPSGNNLNKAVSELRRSFQLLGETRVVITTVPRLGFRFEGDVSCQPREKTTSPEPVVEPPVTSSTSAPHFRFRFRRTALLALALVGVAIGTFHYVKPNFILPATLKPVEENIAGCRIWLINDHGRPLVIAKLAALLAENKVECQRENYDIYYFSARFSIAKADEVFIGACPESKSRFCKTIRYKSGAGK